MTNYTVDTLNLGKFITESGEVIDNLRFVDMSMLVIMDNH